MATRLEIARQKLTRLEKERNESMDKIYQHQALTNGQPMNDKRNGAAWFKKQEQLDNAVRNKLDEIEKQRERVEKLERWESNKASGYNKQGGLIHGVQNIDKLKERKQTAKQRREIEALEAILDKAEKDEQIVSDRAREMIEDGTVKQWAKKPIYYFVSGMHKVALIIGDDGEFHQSKKYPAVLIGDDAKLKGWGID